MAKKKKVAAASRTKSVPGKRGRGRKSRTYKKSGKG